MKLDWQAPTTLADGRPLPTGTVLNYAVYRGNTVANLSKISTIDITGLTFTDPAVVPGQYFYGVTASAVNRLESAPATLDVAPPGFPVNVTVSVVVTVTP